MKKIVLTLTCIFFITAAYTQENINYSGNELIVKFKPNR